MHVESRLQPVGPVMVRLSAYMARARERALPEAVLEKTKHHVLDTLAAMISGAGLPPGRKAMQWRKSHAGPIEAAFADGVLAHADETDDSHGPGRAHPGCATIPAALAMVDALGASGEDFLRAVALGYDVGTRVTMSLGGPKYQAATHRSTHATSGVFCAAAAAGYLAALDERGMRFLLDYASQQVAGYGVWGRDAEHVEKAFVFGGYPASAGVRAALLVRDGWTGVDDVFSGADNFFEAFAPPGCRPELLADGLGERYEIQRTNIKKWSVGSPIQATLDALELFRKKRPFAARDVAKVVVRMATDEHRTVNDRDMPDVCLQHMVAVMLLDGTASFSATHDHARMRDPAVLAQRAKVELHADPRIDAARPRRESIVELTFRDGTRMEEWIKDVRGTAENPMPREEVLAKARDLAVPEKLIETVLKLEELKDAGELRALLVRQDL